MVSFQALIEEHLPRTERQQVTLLSFDPLANFVALPPTLSNVTGYYTTGFSWEDVNHSMATATLDLWEFPNLETFKMERRAFTSQGVDARSRHYWVKIILSNCPQIKEVWVDGLTQLVLALSAPEVAELKDRISDVTGQLASQQASNQITISGLQSQIQAKEQELSRVRNETTNSTAQLRVQISGLQGQLSQAQTEQGRLNGLLTNQGELQARISEHERKVRELETQQVNYLRELGEKGRVIENKEAELNSLTNQNQVEKSELVQQLTNLRREKEEMESRMLREREEGLRAWNAEKLDLERNLAINQAQVDQNLLKIAELERELVSKNEEINSLQAKSLEKAQRIKDWKEKYQLLVGRLREAVEG